VVVTYYWVFLFCHPEGICPKDLAAKQHRFDKILRLWLRMTWGASNVWLAASAKAELKT